jgi:predicted kinase
MPTIHLTRGLPASGKTTLARELVADSKGRMRRVNLDELRAMLDPGTERERKSKAHEETVLAVQDATVLAAIDGGFDIVVDNTHIPSRIPNRLKRAVAGRAVFEIHDLTGVPAEECIRRDAARPNPVGEDTIRAMADRLKAVGKSGWRLNAEQLNDVAQAAPYVPDLSQPPAVVCDIDGTLALHHGRGPYELEKLETDLLNEPVARALALCDRADDHVVLLSGREEGPNGEYREATRRWLAKHHVPYDELWMRPAGDKRGDDIVKAELFDAHVRDRFNVRMVLDDRDRVVALWRRIGLPCWQVNYGNF